MSWMKTGLPKILSGRSRRASALADVAQGRDRFARAGPGRVGCKIDRRGERPVILAGRCVVAQDGAVAHAEFARGAAGDARRLVEEQRAHVGAGLPQGDAAELDRLAAGGIALVRRQVGVAGADGDALHRHVEFVGGDLRHGGEHALAELDAAGADQHFAGRGEGDPAVESRIVVERAGEGCVHDGAPARISAAALATARMMRLCVPQRQILSSSAAAISARVGDGFLSSSALAVITMPDRQ